MKLHQTLIVIFHLSLSILAAAATSDVFYFAIDSKESVFKNLSIITNRDETSIFVAKANSNDQLLMGSIQKNGGFLLQSGKYVTVVKNYLKLSNSTTDYATPFTVDKDGHLNLYGKKDFKAIPSGEQSAWILGTSQATSEASGVYTIQIKATTSDGKNAAQFGTTTSGASSVDSKVWYLLVPMLALYLV